jgi:hypothetical protein
MGDIDASTFAIDNTENTFVRKVYGNYGFQPSPANGGTITDSGVISALPNGVTSLGTTYNETSNGKETTYNPPLTGSWAVEIPGQAALIGLKAYTDFTPAVPTESCPNLPSATAFQFVTLPNHLVTTGTAISLDAWNAQVETAFGSVNILTNGNTVQFSNLSQYTFPASGGSPGAPSNPGPTSALALCSPTFYGQTIGYPSAVTVINPGTSESIPPSATIGIGPSGFLVEDAGTSLVPGQPYENILGAGYGAIGLPTPSGALTTSAVAAEQYQGFIYGSGGPVSSTQSGPGFSLIGSFGYKDLKASCPTLPAPATGTVLYGGEFANNDPSANAFGNCDLAIDLGKQDGTTNGLYPAATVYVTSAFSNNGISKSYTFPAVAIAGELKGKYAIFLIGVDTSGSPSQAWGIYLLQSN